MSALQSADDAFLKSVSAMPPEQQVPAVIAKLKELNPNFDGKEAHRVEGGAVTTLSFSTVGVTDISPVKALKWLRTLTITPPALNQKGSLENLAPLQGMQLTWLWCHNNPITDLSPLKDMPLTVLSFSGTQVSSLAPLTGMKLQVLSFNDTVVNELGPLEGMPLTTVWCNNTKITDLSPLKAMPLREIKCDFVAERDAAILRDIRTLAKINDAPASALLSRAGVTQQMPPRGSSPIPATRAATGGDAAWSRAINLMALLDSKRDAVEGVWTLRSGKLISDKTRHAKLQIPYDPPEEYDFRIQFIRAEGDGSVLQMFTHAGRSACWNMGGWKNTVFGFEMVGGKGSRDNPTAVLAQKGCLQNDRLYTSILQVRKNGVTALLNGKEVSRWSTDYTDASSPYMWTLRNNRFLGVGSYGSPTTFRSMELLEVTGKGAPAQR
jgi:hypothetical protein